MVCCVAHVSQIQFRVQFSSVSISAICCSTLAHAIGSLHLLKDSTLDILWNHFVGRCQPSFGIHPQFEEREDKVFVLGLLLLNVIRTSRFVYTNEIRQGVLRICGEYSAFLGAPTGVVDVSVHIYRLVIQLIYDVRGVCVYRKTKGKRTDGWYRLGVKGNGTRHIVE